MRPDLVCRKERFGHGFCGWDVAVAGIDAQAIVYSFGVGEDVSFDVALIERFNVVIHAFDPTPASIVWVRQQTLPERFVLHEYGLAAFDGNVAFNPPENPAFISHTMLTRPVTSSRAILVPVKRLDTIMHKLGHDHVDVLKMDIEGAEYDVLKDIAQTSIRPRQILVEFHHRFPGVGIHQTKKAIDLLRGLGYRLFAISATNEEFSFILDPGQPSHLPKHVT